MSAADHIERIDDEMVSILAGFVEDAGQNDARWTAVRLQARDHPAEALATLIDLEIHLNHHVRVELSESLRLVRGAIPRLGAELPVEVEEVRLDRLRRARDVDA